MKKQFSQNKFIRHLVKNRLIPLHRINLAYHEQKRMGGTLAAHLLERGYISEDDLNRAISATMDIAYIELIPEKLDRKLAESVPAEILTEYLAVPIAREGGVLRVALADPTDNRALHDLALFSKGEITPVVAPRDAILFALDFLLGAQGGETLKNYRLPDYAPPPDLPYQRIVEDTTGVTLVYYHLLEAWRKKALEVHFEPAPSGLRVRYRTGGGMEDRALYPPVFREICLHRLRIVGEIDSSSPEPGRAVSMTLGGKRVYFAISFFPAYQGTSALISFTEAAEESLAPVEGLKKSREFGEFLSALRLAPGLCVVGGGGSQVVSGLARAAFQEVASPSRKAIAVTAGGFGRDRGYLEIRVAENNDLGCARALQAASRQNPDVLYVDCLDGMFTLQEAVRIAISGSLVVGKSGFGRAVDFLSFALESGLKASQLAPVLRAILMVLPIRVLCPHCRRRATVPPDQKKLDPILSTPDLELWMQGEGCGACRNTGWGDTEWLLDLVVVTPEFRGMLYRAKGAWELRKGWAAFAGDSVFRRAAELLKEGKIDLSQFESLVS